MSFRISLIAFAIFRFFRTTLITLSKLVNDIRVDQNFVKALSQISKIVLTSLFHIQKILNGGDPWEGARRRSYKGAGPTKLNRGEESKFWAHGTTRGHEYSTLGKAVRHQTRSAAAVMGLFNKWNLCSGDETAHAGRRLLLRGSDRLKQDAK